MKGNKIRYLAFILNLRFCTINVQLKQVNREIHTMSITLEYLSQKSLPNVEKTLLNFSLL